MVRMSIYAGYSLFILKCSSFIEKLLNSVSSQLARISKQVDFISGKKRAFGDIRVRDVFQRAVVQR